MKPSCEPTRAPPVTPPFAQAACDPVSMITEALEQNPGPAANGVTQPRPPVQSCLVEARTPQSVQGETGGSSGLVSEGDLLRALLDNVPEYIYFKDAQLRFLCCSRALAVRLGVSNPLQVVGKTELDLLEPERAWPLIQQDQAVLFSGRAMLHQDEPDPWDPAAQHAWVQTSRLPLRNGRGRVCGLVVISRDITAARRDQELLKRSHAETEAIVAAAPAFLIGLDFNGQVCRWNPAAERCFGVSAEAALGRPLKDVGIDWDWPRFVERLNECLTSNRPVEWEDVSFRRPGGSPGVLKLTIAPGATPSGGRFGYLLLGIDATERHRMEGQLRQAQKLEAIGQLAAGIAHEINTPTQFVGDNLRFLRDSFADLHRVIAANRSATGQSDAAARALEAPPAGEPSLGDADLDYLLEEIPKAIDQSLEGITRVTKIVKAMRDFSHPDQGERTAIDLRKAIESTLTVARNEWKYVAEVVTEFDPQLPDVPCFPGDINQVILNLIVNAAHAIEATPQVKAGGKGTITVRTRRDGDWAEIHVQDTGTGIPEAVREKLFSPFFTTKEVGKGTGQGLFIAHTVVVEKHGGTITFETEVGRGTTFIIRLPLNPPPPTGKALS